MVEIYKIAPIEGVDPPQGKEILIWKKLINTGKITFSGTKIVGPDGIFGNKEIDAIDNFINAAAEINPDVFNEGTRQHLRLAGQYSFLLASELKKNYPNVDPYRAACLGMLHDLGRTFTHRKGRNEIIETSLMRKIAFSQDFCQDMYPDTIFAPNALEKMTPTLVAQKIKDAVSQITANPYWAIVLVSDLIAKKNGDRLRRWEDVTKLGHFTKKYEESTKKWPSEKRRWIGAKMPGHEEAINYQYTHVGQWLEENMGTSINSIVEKIEKSTKI